MLIKTSLSSPGALVGAGPRLGTDHAIVAYLKRLGLETFGALVSF